MALIFLLSELRRQRQHSIKILDCILCGLRQQALAHTVQILIQGLIYNRKAKKILKT